MLVYSIAIILWMAVTSIATPPLGYITRSANDKNPPNYRYKYTIDNDNGVGQGKVETRSGELANGRYYINGEQSSTDVKYFADEWGYHPLVKYSASTGHSVANAQLALGEHVVKARVNDTNFVADSQVIQPLLLNSHAIYKVTNDKEPNVERIHVLPVTETHVTEGINDAALTTLEESLIIENSGSFGQRVSNTQTNGSPSLKQSEIYHTTPELSAYSTPTSIIHQVTPVVTDVIIKNSSLNGQPLVYNYKAALASIRDYMSMDSGGEMNHKVPLNPQVFPNILPTGQSHSPPQSRDNSNVELLENLAPQVSPRFSKPIVVAEVANSEQFEYSTTFPCNDLNDESTGSVTSSTIDENIPSSTTPSSTLSSDTAVLVTPKLGIQSRITTSSVILNPIQAGVGLLNAGEAHLISSDTKQGLQFADVSQSIDNPPAIMSSKNSGKPGEDTPNDARQKILDDQPKFDKVVAINSPSHGDQSFVIEKSREVYHNTPIEEIHYPVEVASQVVPINHLSPSYLNIPYENAQVEKGKTYTDQGNGNFAYQSIVDRPELLLQELQTSPESATYIYHQDQQVKNNVNNLDAIPTSTDSTIIQKTIPDIILTNENVTGEGNFPSDTGIKHDHVYSAFEVEKLLVQPVNIHQPEVGLQSLKIQDNNGQDNTKSSLERLLANERQANVYAQSTHITGNTVPLTEIQMKEISSEIEKPTLPYSLSMDVGKSTIYIHGQTEQGLLDIGNYPSQTISDQENPLVTHVSTVEKLEDKNFISQPQDLSKLYANQDKNLLDRAVTVLKPYSVERIVEKRLPYIVHKQLPQLYPVHILEPYPVEKIVEKPVAMPVTVEKVVEKKVSPSPTYSMETLIKQAHPLEQINYIDNSINVPYGVQYGVSYQQIMKPGSNNLYDNNPIDQQMQNNGSGQQFQGYYYDKPLGRIANPRLALTKRYGSLSPLGYSKQIQGQQSGPTIYAKKIQFANQLALPLQSRTVDHQASPHRHLVYRAIDKGSNKNNVYIGPVPLPQHALNLHQQNQVVHPLHQETLRYLATVGRSNGGSNFRRTRLPDVHYQSRTSNFRQSKMEYGFKPPMVPSVQYDEQTATRVEN